MRSLKSQKGQSLMEVLIAMAIFVVGVATIGFLVLDANVSTRQGVERTQAILLAKEGLEAARSIRDADFDNLTAGPHGIVLSSNKWIFSGTSDMQDQFTRVITVTDIDVDTKKIDSAITWQFTQVRQNSVTLTDYLTDWNQTHGNAGELNVDISNAALAVANKQLQGITIENTGSSDITIAQMTLWWDNSNLLTTIRIDNTNVYGPAGSASSGTEIDITNVELAADAGIKDINRFVFDASMLGTDFIIKFLMSDGSTKYALVEPGAGPPPGNQADSLVVNIAGAAIDGGDNTKVVGITIENSGASDIIIDKMTVFWMGAPGGTKINAIAINGSPVWSGNNSSGDVLDITNFTLASGGSYPINYLDFSKNMTGTALSITFTMSDGSIKSTCSFSP
ncbi:MAG: prepilin-type N-terminal cleavage/methylation domain-containing protein [Minisyncoccales bacterium]